MKVRFDKISCPLYCDAGPYEGDLRTDLVSRLYLSPDEYASYAGSESLQITLSPGGDGCLQTGNTAGSSGELPAGDVVAAGDVLLAAGRPAGWEPAPARWPRSAPDSTGTNPLPSRSWLAGTGLRAGQAAAASSCEEPGA